MHFVEEMCIITVVSNVSSGQYCDFHLMDYKTGEKSNTISCQFVNILHFVAKLYDLIGTFSYDLLTPQWRLTGMFMGRPFFEQSCFLCNSQIHTKLPPRNIPYTVKSG